MNEFEKTTLNAAIEKYGYKAQQAMMIEEMSELIKAICKFWRNKNRSSYDNVLEEMADVEIMLEQMKIMFEDPAEIREKKIHRLFHRITGEEV